jgi:hypothetical protein
MLNVDNEGNSFEYCDPDWAEDPRKLNITDEQLGVLKGLLLQRDDLPIDLVCKIIMLAIGVK